MIVQYKCGINGIMEHNNRNKVIAENIVLDAQKQNMHKKIQTRVNTKN